MNRALIAATVTAAFVGLLAFAGAAQAHTTFGDKVDIVCDYHDQGGHFIDGGTAMHETHVYRRYAYRIRVYEHTHYFPRTSLSDFGYIDKSYVKDRTRRC